MRNSPILSIALVCLSFHITNAQQFILTSELGGGRLYSLETTGSNPTILKDFSFGSRPLDNLTLADDKYWGLTSEGGDHNYGVVFSIDKDGSNYEEHHHFEYADGTIPVGELTLIDGKLWGATRGGGTSNWGTIFTVDFMGNFSKVIDVQSFSGRIPEGKLVDFNGKVWGVTTIGGLYSDGCIFYLNYDGTGATKHYDFNDSDGANPEGGLTLANNELWGITRLGGANNAGSIFTINQAETVTTNRHDFNTTDGYLPFNFLVESGGEMWGLTKHGGTNDDGVIFSISTADYSFTKHHDFSGSQSTGTLLSVGSDLWGLTNEGGTARFGTIFKITNDGSGFEELHEFNYDDGAYPKGGFIQDGDLLVGMTEFGGHDLGTIFSFDRTTEQFVGIHMFGNPDGTSPIARPIESCGVLIGGVDGGDEDNGLIYEINLDGTGFNIVHELSEDEGQSPTGFAVYEGEIWSFTLNGGANGAGTIISMSLDGSNFMKQHDFETANGHAPMGDPIIENGIIYGATRVGGDQNKGVVFSYNIESGVYTKLHDFADGSAPDGNLLFSNDRLWGTTTTGGTNVQGTLFSIKTDGTDFTDHHDFLNGTSGIRPSGSLAESNGRIWGTSQSYVYSIAADGTDFKVEHTLTNDLGPLTESGVILYDDKLWIGGGMNQDIISASLLSMNSDGTSLGKIAEYSRDYGGPTSIMVVEDKMDQTITADAVTKTFGDDPFMLSASSNSSNTLYYKSYDDGIISIDGSEATINGAGETTIFVYQNADGTYYSGCHSVVVTVAKASQSITFESIADKLTSDSPFDAVVSSNSGLDVTLVSSDENVATVSGKTITIQGVGEVSITATQSGSDDYLAATEVIQTFNVSEPPAPPLSIADDDQLIVYPNPSLGAFKVEVKGLSQVTLLDLTGKVLVNRPANGSSLLEFSGFPAGVYMLKGEGKEGTFTRRLIIK